jgi:hypothetical protein
MNTTETPATATAQQTATAGFVPHFASMDFLTRTEILREIVGGMPVPDDFSKDSIIQYLTDHMMKGQVAAELLEMLEKDG